MSIAVRGFLVVCLAVGSMGAKAECKGYAGPSGGTYTGAGGGAYTGRGVANIRGRSVLDILGQVVVRIQGLAAVPIRDRVAVLTRALVDRVIWGLTTAKLTDGIGRHHTVSRLRLSLYFQHSSTVVH